MTKPTDMDLAWAAGFIDADGAIYIARQRAQSRGFSHTPTVSAVQVDPTPILILRDLFGGDVRRTKPQVSRPNQMETYNWRVTARQALPVLCALLPYFRVKRRQAEIAIELQLRRRHTRDLSQPEIDRREELYRIMRMLNRRSVVRGPEQRIPERSQSPQLRLIERQV